jgi:hypothetical protein
LRNKLLEARARFLGRQAATVVAPAFERIPPEEALESPELALARTEVGEAARCEVDSLRAPCESSRSSSPPTSRSLLGARSGRVTGCTAWARPRSRSRPTRTEPKASETQQAHHRPHYCWRARSSWHHFANQKPNPPRGRQMHTPPRGHVAHAPVPAPPRGRLSGCAFHECDVALPGGYGGGRACDLG